MLEAVIPVLTHVHCRDHTIMSSSAYWQALPYPVLQLTRGHCSASHLVSSLQLPSGCVHNTALDDKYLCI